MDYALVVLRLTHIVAAFAWIAAGTCLTLVILPAIQAADEPRARGLGGLLVHPWIIRAFPISAGLTILAGILLYVVSRAGSHFSSTGNAVLGIGALVGVLAGIHGGALTGRAVRALRHELTEPLQGKQPPPGAAGRAWPGLTRSAVTHSRISLLLMVIALVAMSSARYL